MISVYALRFSIQNICFNQRKWNRKGLSYHSPATRCKLNQIYPSSFYFSVVLYYVAINLNYT